MGRLLVLFVLFSGYYSYGQGLVQDIRGTVVDSETKFPLVGAKVLLFLPDSSSLGAKCDFNGDFSISDVPVGKHVLQVSASGYDQSNVTAIVISGKETVLNVLLVESAIVSKEVVVTARKNGEAINEMALVGTQSFSVEETNRYAGSRGDPARMVSNFAGAQGTDDSRNDIVIRGNSPLGIAYRIEGVTIPNPNHFAIAGSAGGPVAILNNKFLDNSDFFMSAFPAEYGNSISGVFDLRLRKGNNNIHEFSGQFGFLGTELLFEGPISKKTGSSYLIMGRYSTLSLFERIGLSYGTDAVPTYGDGAFKFNFPAKKGGQYSIWGLGGFSSIDILISDQVVPAQDAFGEQDRDQFFGTDMGIAGVTYTKPLNKKLFFKTTLSYAVQRQRTQHDFILRNLNPDSTWNYLAPPFNMMGYLYDIKTGSAYMSLNHKINSQHVIKYGLNVDGYYFNMNDSIRFDIADSTSAFYKRWDYQSNQPAFLLQGFVQWKYKISKIWTMSTGLHSQYFTLNNSVSPIEPRFAMNARFGNRNEIAFGAGMHSQTHPLYIYSYHLLDSNGDKVYHNLDMDFSRSIHTVLSYSKSIKKSTVFKTETYYQYLYDVPVEVNPSSFSLLNQGSGFARFFPDSLENTGTGFNYGLEFTLQKFFDNNFFFMTTASFYESKYRGSDGELRDTDFNGNYILNGLIGKEWQLGESGKHMLQLGARVTYAGGKRYGYVDVAATDSLKEIIFLDEGYNELRFKNYFRADVKVNYILNTKKVTHEFGLDIVNMLNTQNILGLTYTPNETNPMQPYAERYQLGLLPIFYYKIDFKVAGKKE